MARALFRRASGEVDAADEDVVGPAPWGWRRLALVFGVPLMAAQILVLAPWAVAEVEQRLAVELRGELEASGIDTSELAIGIDYRRAVVSGTLPAGVEPFMIEERLVRQPVRSVELWTVAGELPTAEAAGPGSASPIVESSPGVELAVAHDGVRVVVAGSLDSEAQGNVVLEALDLLTGRAEIDHRRLLVGAGRSQPADDQRIADLLAALDTVDSAERWRLRLTGRSLTVEAQAADRAVAEAVGGLARTLGAVPTQVILYEDFDDPLEVVERSPRPTRPLVEPRPSAGEPTAEGPDVADPAPAPALPDAPEDDDTQAVVAVTAEDVAGLQADLDALAEELRTALVFEDGQHRLGPAAPAALDQVALVMSEHPGVGVSIVGHTDDVGDPAGNAALSARRASAVGSYLVSLGLDPELVPTRGAGQDEPIASNETEAGRAANRRVTFTAFAPELADESEPDTEAVTE